MLLLKKMQGLISEGISEYLVILRSCGLTLEETIALENQMIQNREYIR